MTLASRRRWRRLRLWRGKRGKNERGGPRADRTELQEFVVGAIAGCFVQTLPQGQPPEQTSSLVPQTPVPHPCY
eukprot:3014070-Amphidinium_carterae.1